MTLFFALCFIWYLVYVQEADTGAGERGEEIAYRRHQRACTGR
jgi:hypothetical protein